MVSESFELDDVLGCGVPGGVDDMVRDGGRADGADSAFSSPDSPQPETLTNAATAAYESSTLQLVKGARWMLLTPGRDRSRCYQLKSRPDRMATGDRSRLRCEA